MANEVKHETKMKQVFRHVRTFVFRGFFALIPLFLCVMAIQVLYVFIDKKVIVFLDRFISIKQIPGLGILSVLAALYLVGLVVSNIAGRQFFKFLDDLSGRIPLINVIYSIGKQLSQSLSLAGSEKQAFKKAVLVKVDNSGLMVPAFVMSTKISSETGEELYFVLIPTAPTPASGFVFVVKASQTVDPGWSVEECLKTVVSVGIIVPKDLKV